MSGIKRSDAQWLEIVKEQRLSGQTAKAWCTAKGISYYTYVDRVARLRKEGKINEPKPKRGGKPVKSAEWVEIANAYDESGESLSRKDTRLPATDISIKIGAFTITIPPAFEEVVFMRVCKVLMTVNGTPDTTPAAGESRLSLC